MNVRLRLAALIATAVAAVPLLSACGHTRHHYVVHHVHHIVVHHRHH